MAKGISALGEAVQRYELMQASTQLSEFKRKVREEHNRLAMSYDGNLDPTTFKAEYEKSLQVRRGLIPKNRFAAREAQLWLNDRMPIWEAGVEKSRQLRVEDNFRAEGFELKTEAERTGDMTKYFQHLEVGRRSPLNVYGKEEIAILKQNTIESRERFVRAEEIKRKADAKERLAQAVEQEEQNFLIKLRDTSLSENDVMNSLVLNVDKKQEWLGYIEKQRIRILSDEDIITNQTIKGELESLAYDISTGAVTLPELRRRLKVERYENETIDDSVYDEIFSLGERKFDSYQAEAMRVREVHALGQLVTFPSELGFTERLALLTSQFEKDQAQVLRQLQFDNLDRYKKALRDWLKKNKDANADEIYKEGRRLLTHYRKTPEQLRNPISAGEAAVKAIKEIAAEVEIKEFITDPFNLGQEGQIATDPKTGKKMIRRKDKTGKLKWFPYKE